MNDAYHRAERRAPREPRRRCLEARQLDPVDAARPHGGVDIGGRRPTENEHRLDGAETRGKLARLRCRDRTRAGG